MQHLQPLGATDLAPWELQPISGPLQWTLNPDLEKPAEFYLQLHSVPGSSPRPPSKRNSYRKACTAWLTNFVPSGWDLHLVLDANEWPQMRSPLRQSLFRRMRHTANFIPLIEQACLKRERIKTFDPFACTHTATLKRTSQEASNLHDWSGLGNRKSYFA